MAVLTRSFEGNGRLQMEHLLGLGTIVRQTDDYCFFIGTALSESAIIWRARARSSLFYDGSSLLTS